jgi:Rrf2 family transcriptional regulator, repressor of oqxAB
MIDLRFATALQMVLSVALAEHDNFRVTSKMLAEGLGTNPSLIRKLLFPLSRDGLIRPSVGKGGGLRLGRAPDRMTLRDVYQSVTENKRILAARNDVPRRCRISANINDFFDTVTGEAEKALLDTLHRRTIAEGLADILRLDERRHQRRRGSNAPVIDRMSTAGRIVLTKSRVTT